MKKCLICILCVLVCLSLDTQAQGTKKVKVSARERLINEYYMMADSCYKNNNYHDAILYANKGVSEINNIKKFKELYYELKMVDVLSYMNLNEFRMALTILDELEKISLTSWHQAKIYLNEFYCYREIEDWHQVISSAEKSLHIVNEWDDTKDVILNLKQGIAKSYARLGLYDISNEYYSSTLELAKELESEEDYIRCCSEIYFEFYDKWYSTLVIDVISELMKFHEENFSLDEDYCYLIQQRGDNFRHLGNFEFAHQSYQEAINIYQSLNDKKYNSDYCFEADLYSVIAYTVSTLGRFDEAYYYLDKAEIAFAEHSDDLYNFKKNQLLYDRALIMLNEGTRDVQASIILKELIEDEIDGANNEVWLATLYYNLGVALEGQYMDEALDAYNTALSHLYKGPKNGVRFAKTLNQIATIYHSKNDISTALRYYESAIGIYKNLSESDNLSYIHTLSWAARCAYNFGEYGRAIAWAEESRNIQTTSIGFVSPQAWSVLLDSYKRVNNLDAYNCIYEEYKMYSNNGLDDISFAEREADRLYSIGDVEGTIEYLNNLEISYSDHNLQKNYDINIDRYILPQSYRFDSYMESWQNNNYEWSLWSFAAHLLNCGEYESANSILKSIHEVGKVDTQYLIESWYASYAMNDLEHLQKIVNTSVQTFRDQLKAVMGMSSLEKEEYWGEMSLLKNLIGTLRESIPISKQLFDISLIYKNFLVHSDVNFLRVIKQTENEKVRNHASELLSIKELLASPSAHNYNLDSLKLREIEINRQIIQNIKNLSDFECRSNHCCDTIASALAPNEVAIEIADYYNDQKKNYVAMLLRKDWKEPVLIELGEETQLTSILNKNLTIKKLYDPYLPSSTELYDFIWKPIVPYLNTSDIIYISPSGVLSTIAIEVLSSDDGVYVSDIYDIKRVSSTAYVLERECECDYNSFCVFGGAQYDSNVNLSYSQGCSIWDSGYLLDRSAYEDIEYLPGTKKEAEMISKMITESKANVFLHIGPEANEYAFKDLSGNATEVIHIATHGFYIPIKETSSYQYCKDNSGSLAMERSGLILSGAYDAWNGKLTPGVEDGILTSSEIAKLDLSNTNLVVMSACETGLGDITEDGIEGLQRAFKSAGVETLVMSLWKVDDKATEMLMEEFYKLLLKGYSKDDAFQSAKTKVRNKKSYSSPYYWASFIMLD